MAERKEPWWPDLLPLAGGIWILVLFVRQVLQRVGYPFDLEWMEGGMLLHAARVLEGKSLYVEPAPDFIPFIYTPLYPWAVAALSKVVGFGYAAGRWISFAGTLAAAAALVAAIRVERGSILFGVGVAGLFLSTYDETGSFMDLVRADGLMMGLLAWSLVSARAEWFRAAGFVLFAAFTAKHNTAIFGLPMLLWAWRFHGRAAAIRFALWSVVPALVFTVLLQVATDGLFLTYVLGVPAAHPYVAERGYPLAQVELGRGLPLACLLGSLGLALYLEKDRRALAMGGVVLALAIVFGVAAALDHQGFLAGWRAGIGAAFPPKSVVADYLQELFKNPTTFAWVLGTPFVLLFLVVAAIRGRWSTSAAFWAPTTLLAIVLASIMRAHHGGFVNVLMPAFWFVALWGGLGALTIAQAWPSWIARAVVGLVVGAQCVLGRWDLSAYTPTDEDVAAGWALIDRLAAIEGEILAPQNPYYPVLAGKNPSFALIALWDIDHPRGPLQSHVKAIEQTIRDARWAAILTTDKDLGYGLKSGYVRDRTFKGPPGRLMRPRAGWPAKPSQLWIPKGVTAPGRLGETKVDPADPVDPADERP